MDYAIRLQTKCEEKTFTAPTCCASAREFPKHTPPRNLSYPTIGIVRFYNGRGTAGAMDKRGKVRPELPATSSRLAS